MKKREEEHYWSRFAGSYDRDGEYVVGKRIIQLIEKALLSEEPAPVPRPTADFQQSSAVGGGGKDPSNSPFFQAVVGPAHSGLIPPIVRPGDAVKTETTGALIPGPPGQAEIIALRAHC